MAPAASTLAATSAASKRPPAEQLQADSSSLLPQVDDEAARSKGQQQQLECPRCHDTNTKFCYYNNYSTAQPRHFCRACRRYWTHGGTLRDVPVGGATRRSKRRRLSSDEPSESTTRDARPPPPDLSTAFPFLSDGSYYLPPQLDLGLFAPAAFSWPSSVLPDFYDVLAPWDDGTVGGGSGVTGGAWGDIVNGPELSWPPPSY